MIKRKFYKLEFIFKVLIFVVICIPYAFGNIMEWHDNSKQMYHVNLKYNIEFNAPGKNSSRFTQEIDGILNFIVLEVGQNEVHVSFQLSPVSISFSGKRVPELEKIYSTFFLATLEKTGKPLQFYFPNKVSQEEELIVSEVIKGLQAYFPETNQKEWLTEESHSTGTYKARYTVKEYGILKEKLKYLSLNTGSHPKDSLEPKPVIVYSKFIIKPSETLSWLESMSGKEKFVLKMGDIISTTTNVTASMKMIPLKPDFTLEIWKERRAFAEILTSFRKGEKKALSYWKEKEMEALREKVQHIKLDEVISKLIDTNGKDINQKYLLVDYINVYPEEALKIPKLLIQNQASDKSFSVITNALELSGTQQAQKALTDMMSDESLLPNNRLQAAMALGGIKNPTENTIKALYEMFKIRKDKESCEISNTVILALGRISNAVRAENHGLSKTINGQLSEYLSQTSNNKEIIIILKAMGNAADPSFVRVVTPFISSESEDIRKAAVQAYRRLNDAHSLTILVKRLAVEKNIYVKKAILETLTNRQPNIMSIVAVQRLISKEKDKDIRNTMNKYLAKNKKIISNGFKILKK